jgi:hypothetical protein
MLKVLLLIFLLCSVAAVCALILAHLNLHPLASNAVADRVLVEKAARRLTLLGGGNTAEELSRRLRALAGWAEGTGRRSTDARRYLLDRFS